MRKRFTLILLVLCLAAMLVTARGKAADDSKKVGPAGGDGGEQFSDKELPKGARVIGVKIRHGLYIDGIELLYKTADGKKEGLGWHGGDGGEEGTFLLEDGEHIIGIKGKTGDYVESLTIVTNKRKSKTYGGDGGEKTYDLKAEDHEVIGFYGRAGAYIDQIGIVVKKKK